MSKGKRGKARLVKEIVASRQGYFILRRQAHAKGFSDEDYPRYHKVIGEWDVLGVSDLERLQKGLAEEKSFLRLYKKNAQFNREADRLERDDPEYVGKMRLLRYRLTQEWLPSLKR